ncbi:VOC family protein [Myxococcota bacterium]|nr:VOC family protein [Myxococcota bacterium]
MASDTSLTTSHLIVHVADTDATIDFWCKGLGAELETDEELEAPALDEIFGRKGVRIRDTFIRAGGTRLHTIETLDVKRQPIDPPQNVHSLGLGGISFRVQDLDAAHARAEAEGRNPTPIYDFDEIAEPVRMFFLNDPDGIRVEMIEDGG